MVVDIADEKTSEEEAKRDYETKWDRYLLVSEI